MMGEAAVMRPSLSKVIDMVYDAAMTAVRITSSGQLSLPAEIRRRWAVQRLRLVDHGDHVTLEPIADDVVAATFGRFAGDGPSTAELRVSERAETSERQEPSSARLRRVPAGRRSAR